MCGRFALTLPNDAMAQLFDAAPHNALPDTPRYNICPTQEVAVVTSQNGARALRPMRWGFVPQWYKTVSGGPLLINARAETIADKPAFAKAVRTRRCVIPATSFFEWTKEGEDKLPWSIARKDTQPMMFAGLWQDWRGPEDALLTTCAIVTCAASPDLSALHHRMPVILEPASLALWLGEAGHGAAPLMRATPAGTLTWHRVTAQVNRARGNEPAFLDPIPTP
ncbi:MAG: SOS response-associated peptidase [Pseudomonadota bacterium]